MGAARHRKLAEACLVKRVIHRAIMPIQHIDQVYTRWESFCEHSPEKVFMVIAVTVVGVAALLFLVGVSK